MWSSTFFSLLYSTWCQWFPLLNPHCRFGRRLGLDLSGGSSALNNWPELLGAMNIGGKLIERGIYLNSLDS